MSFTVADWDAIASDGWLTDNWTVIATDGIFYSIYVPPVITVPENRIYYAPAEDRTYYVRAESRTMTLPGESRTNLVNSESRTAVYSAIS